MQRRVCRPTNRVGSKIRRIEICVLFRSFFVGRGFMRFWNRDLHVAYRRISGLRVWDSGARPGRSLCLVPYLRSIVLRFACSPVDVMQYVEVGAALAPTRAGDQSGVFQLAEIDAQHGLARPQFSGERGMAGKTAVVLQAMMEEQRMKRSARRRATRTFFSKRQVPPVWRSE